MDANTQLINWVDANMFIVTKVLRVIPAMLIIAANEYLKAFLSVKLGDKLPKAANRLTLNPLKHLDVIGLGFMIWFGYGFGKPAETSPLHYKDRRKGTIIVYALPILFLFAAGIGLFYLNMLITQMMIAKTLPAAFEYVGMCIYIAGDLCIKYAVVNIIPVYPLNGNKILSVFLKPRAVVKMAQYEKIMQVLLIFAIIFGLLDYIAVPFISLIF